jgi:hypothetical protein
VNDSFDWKNGLVAIFGHLPKKGYSGPVGTGFIVSHDGLIVTCQHVVEQSDWPYGQWDTPLKVRLFANHRFDRALVLKEYLSFDLDLAILRLESGLPDQVEPLPLWQSESTAGHTIAMWGYPAGYRAGLLGRGQILGSEGRELLQFTSTQATHGYSGSPVWDEQWQRAIGMITASTEEDSLGRLKYENLALPVETLVAHSRKLLSLKPPTSPIANATRHISAAVDTLMDRYARQVFVGRDETLTALDNWLQGRDSGRLVITALAGYGKTALLAHWTRVRQAAGDAVACHFFSDRYEVLRSEEDACANLLRQLANCQGRYDETLPLEGAPRRSRLFDLVESHDGHRDGRLIIVLDALDEAQETFQLNLPRPLPPGVFLVASARAGDQSQGAECPPYLDGWIDKATLLHLDRLPEVALQGWLSRASAGLLAAQSDPQSFIRRLFEITDGYPLYLSYLIDDLVAAWKDGEDLDRVLEATPHGFSVYVDHQRSKIAAARGDRKVSDLFILLAVARYPLGEDEVLQLTELDELELDDLPPGVTRWLNIGRGPDSQVTYALAHARLAQEFETLWPKAAAQTYQRLLAWCAGWPDHSSAFALRHYADLLYRAERWDDLYDLARDEAFADRQQQVVVADPDLQLRAVRLALQAAGQQERAGLMTEFLLRHARRLTALRRMSPLAALRTLPGRAGLERAWQLAEAHAIERRIPWFLLLAWALVNDGRQEDTRDTLTRLSRTPLHGMSSGHIGRLARWLLVRLAAYEAEVVTNLIRAITFQERHLVVDDLLEGQLYDVAWAVVPGMPEDKFKIRALGSVVSAQAQGGDFAGALSKVSSIEDDRVKARVLESIATAQAEAGDFDGAMATAGDILDEGFKACALASIAVAETLTGNVDAGEEAFIRALAAADKTVDKSSKARALEQIAAGQARAGDLQAAQATAFRGAGTRSMGRARALIAAVQVEAGDFDGAQATADGIGDAFLRGKALVTIGSAQAQSGMEESAEDTFARALAAVAVVGKTSVRHWILMMIAAAQARTGQFKRALATADEIGDESTHARALKTIAVAMARAGDFEWALATAKGIEDSWSKKEALTSIAVAQAQEDDLAGALATANVTGDEALKERAPVMIAIAQAQAGMNTVAENNFAMALTQRDGFSDEPSSEEVLMVIASAQGWAQEFDKALATAGSIGDEEFKAGSLALIVAARTQAGDIDGALATAKSIPDERHRAGVLALVGVAQAKAGLAEAARGTFRLAQAACLDIGLWIEFGIGAQAQVRGTIVAAMAAAGDIDGALATIRHILDPKYRAAPLGAIAAAQAQAGMKEAASKNLGLALAAVEAIPIAMQEIRARALTSIAVAQAQGGDFDGAMRTVGRIGNDQYGSLALWSIAAVQAQLGSAKDAEATYALAMTKVESIDDEKSRAEALGGMAAVQAQSGDTSRFPTLLRFCLSVPGTVLSLCGAIARLYPEQAADVAEVLINQGR